MFIHSSLPFPDSGSNLTKAKRLRPRRVSVEQLTLHGPDVMEMLCSDVPTETTALDLVTSCGCQVLTAQGALGPHVARWGQSLVSK